jgi:hypothetical protein
MVAYPWASGLRSRACSTWFSWALASLGLRPARPAPLGAGVPSRCQACESAPTVDPPSATKTDPPGAMPRRPGRAFRGVRLPGRPPRGWADLPPRAIPVTVLALPAPGCSRFLYHRE